MRENLRRIGRAGTHRITGCFVSIKINSISLSRLSTIVLFPSYLIAAYGSTPQLHPTARYHTIYITYYANMSNSASSLLISKNANVTSQIPSPSQSQSCSSIGAESYPHRRGGGSGSFGAGATSRTTPSTARNNQSFRKQHKGQRRPRLADEDAAAESVGLSVNLRHYNKRTADVSFAGRRQCSPRAVEKGRPQSLIS